MNTYIFTEDEFTSRFNDPEGKSLDHIKITSLPTKGALKLSGVLVTLNQNIPRASLNNLTYSPEENEGGTDYTSFNYQVSNGTLYSSTSYIITITVNCLTCQYYVGDINKRSIGGLEYELYTSPIEYEVNQSLFGGNLTNSTPTTSIMISTDQELIDAKLSSIPSSNVEIFNNWYRFSHITALSTQPAVPSELTAWAYDPVTDQISCTINSTSHIGFISLNSYEDYDFLIRVSSDGTDDDMVGFVIAFYVDPVTNREYTLTAQRTGGNLGLRGLIDSQWGIAYNYSQSDSWIIAENSAVNMTGRSNWNLSPNGTMIRINKSNNIITAQTSAMDSTVLDLLTTITIDLNSDARLAKFKGAQRYGYCAYSQQNATFEVLQSSDIQNLIYDVRNGDVWQYLNSTWEIVFSADSIETNNSWDGRENTINLASSGYTTASQIRNLNINGCTDWYIPSMEELNLIYNQKAPYLTSDSLFSRIQDDIEYPVGSVTPTQAYPVYGEKNNLPIYRMVWSSNHYPSITFFLKSFTNSNYIISNRNYNNASNLNEILDSSEIGAAHQFFVRPVRRILKNSVNIVPVAVNSTVTLGIQINTSPVAISGNITIQISCLTGSSKFISDLNACTVPYSIAQTSTFDNIGTPVGKYCGGVLGINEKIYGIPYNASSILEIDPINKTLYRFGSLSGSGKWFGGVAAPDGMIYAIPYNMDSILQINPVNQTNSLFTGVGSDTFKWAGGVLAEDGYIYGIPYNSSTILKFNYITKAITLTNFGSNLLTTGTTTTAKWMGGVLGLNGNIYCIPYNETSVLEINPTTQQISKFGSLDTGIEKWAGGVLAQNGKIYGIPYGNGSVLEIDPVARTATTFGGASGTKKYHGGALSTNGRIYGIPNNSTTVLEINPVTKTVSLIGTLETGYKWVGGVLAPNGKIYGIPYNAVYSLEINLGTPSIPVDICLSKYLNKY
jgi:hypothetical protein